jgi:predicted glycoside hydrolase/deacetylase ChbG (UPF0249 family)
VDPEDVRREFTAQLELVQELGIPVTHLDAHQHLHLWPSVCRVVLDLAHRFRIPSVRVPRLRKPSLTGAGVTLLGRRLARRAKDAGLRFPVDAAGIECAGRLTPSRLREVLARLADHGAPTVELTVHPGEDEDPDRIRYRWGYGWPQELEALVGDAARRAVAEFGFALGTYADLPCPASVRAW